MSVKQAWHAVRRQRDAQCIVMQIEQYQRELDAIQAYMSECYAETALARDSWFAELLDDVDHRSPGADRPRGGIWRTWGDFVNYEEYYRKLFRTFDLEKLLEAAQRELADLDEHIEALVAEASCDEFA